LALIGFSESNSRYPGAGHQPLTVLFNPRITVLDSTLQGFWEGCLSVPELRGFVQRPRAIQIDYLDQYARPQSLEARDFLATVFQHELDHLDGHLYVDRMQDPTKFAFLPEYQRHWVERGAEMDL
jgi:peptide deformylase